MGLITWTQRALEVILQQHNEKRLLSLDPKDVPLWFALPLHVLKMGIQAKLIRVMTERKCEKFCDVKYVDGIVLPKVLLYLYLAKI